MLAPTVLADGTKQFELTAAVVEWEVEPGKMVEAWTYNGTVPGPTIQVDDGDKVRDRPAQRAARVDRRSTSTASTSRTRWTASPDITQDAGEAGRDLHLRVHRPAAPAVGMYHSHHDAAKQVPNGLAGAFLVGDEPVPAGVDRSTQEQVMMLNDAGTIGFSLNGKSFPATAPIVAKQGDWVEVHYMNEGTADPPDAPARHAAAGHRQGRLPAGQPVPRPTPSSSAPGERYTVLVHATEPGTWVWHCHILTHAESDDGMFGMVTALVVS